MASTSAFYGDGETAINKKVETETGTKTVANQIGKVYELSRCSEWMSRAGYKRVALQFPDEMMADAVAVATRLQTDAPTGTEVFILGDTSYGSCCVDEVAAQHYAADAIIHYGRSCLSQPCKMPVLFVFGSLPLDIADCAQQFSKLFPDTSANVILLYDTVYAYARDNLLNCLHERYKNLIVSQLSISRTTSDTVVGTGVTKCGREVDIPSDKTLTDYSTFYVGQESLTFTNLIYNFQSYQFYSYNPETKIGRKENINVNKMLMKRYFLIEKAKDARIVGILVGTLGVANYGEMLNRLKMLIKKAGKRSYVFIVGKINVAKLANFMEIDIFVLIACSENTMLDSSEFYKPVVTPYEMELACNTDREWTGQYPTEFGQLLEGGTHYVPVPDSIVQDETDISLVTGKMRRIRPIESDVETGTSLVLRSDAMTVATQADSAGEFLEMRSWQGLQQNLGETAVTKAVEGQTGIAMGYSNESKLP